MPAPARPAPGRAAPAERTTATVAASAAAGTTTVKAPRTGASTRTIGSAWFSGKTSALPLNAAPRTATRASRVPSSRRVSTKCPAFAGVPGVEPADHDVHGLLGDEAHGVVLVLEDEADGTGCRPLRCPAGCLAHLRLRGSVRLPVPILGAGGGP